MPLTLRKQRAGHVGVRLAAGGAIRAPALDQLDLEVVERGEVGVAHLERAP